MTLNEAKDMAIRSAKGMECHIYVSFCHEMGDYTYHRYPLSEDWKPTVVGYATPAGRYYDCTEGPRDASKGGE